MRNILGVMNRAHISSASIMRPYLAPLPSYGLLQLFCTLTLVWFWRPFSITNFQCCFSLDPTFKSDTFALVRFRWPIIMTSFQCCFSLDATAVSDTLALVRFRKSTARFELPV